MGRIIERKILISYFIFIGIVAIVFFLWESSPNQTKEGYNFWGTALIIINLIPTLVYLSQAKKNIPFLPMVGAHYIIAYALPVFFMELTEFQLGVLEVSSLEICFFGLLCFYAFYYLASGIFSFDVHYSPFNKEDDSNPRVVKQLMYLFIFVALAARFFSVSFIFHFSEPSLYVSTGLFLYLRNFKKLKLTENLLIGFIILFEIIIRMSSGMLAEVAVFLLYIFIIQFILSRKVNFLPIVLFIGFYALTSPVKFKFREIVWFGEKNYTKLEQLIIMKDLALENLNSEKENPMNPKKEEEHFLWRFSYPASALSHIQDVTPEVVPYWGGYTYLPLFSKFVPRVFWPDKPVEEIGQEFGHRYKLLDSTDSGTSMNLPWMAELYANWGKKGVYLGYALIGVLFSFINKYFNHTANTNLNLIVSAAIIFPLVMHESNFSLQMGNVPLLAFSLVFFIRVCKKYLIN